MRTEEEILIKLHKILPNYAVLKKEYYHFTKSCSRSKAFTASKAEWKKRNSFAFKILKTKVDTLKWVLGEMKNI